MISIKIHYLPPLSELISKQSENMEIEAGKTVSKLIDKLFNTYRENFEEHKINRSSPYIVIRLNDKTLSREKLNIALNNDDFITLWMPVAGG